MTAGYNIARGSGMKPCTSTAALDKGQPGCNNIGKCPIKEQAQLQVSNNLRQYQPIKADMHPANTPKQRKIESTAALVPDDEQLTMRLSRLHQNGN